MFSGVWTTANNNQFHKFCLIVLSGVLNPALWTWQNVYVVSFLGAFMFAFVILLETSCKVQCTNLSCIKQHGKNRNNGATINKDRQRKLCAQVIIELYGLHTDSNWISLNLCNGREPASAHIHADTQDRLVANGTLLHRTYHACMLLPYWHLYENCRDILHTPTTANIHSVLAIHHTITHAHIHENSLSFSILICECQTYEPHNLYVCWVRLLVYKIHIPSVFFRSFSS